MPASFPLLARRLQDDSFGVLVEMNSNALNDGAASTITDDLAQATVTIESGGTAVVADVSDFVVEIITASPTPIPTPILGEESDGVVQLSVVGEDCVGEDCSGSQEETEAKKPTVA